jgi:hypothetical protein
MELWDWYTLHTSIMASKFPTDEGQYYDGDFQHWAEEGF